MDPEAVNNEPRDGNFKMPSLEEILQALENMEGISDEEKEKLRDNLMARANEAKPGFMSAVDGPPSGMAPDLAILFGLITVVGLIFAFFGYKLYKSLTARERRKEEKRRQKQQKKKK
ncbi:uncharacterized protein LOC123011308 isoform X1 [Tribolium madens]|uniref:uncharacterized protein LOC123011308 isoform X1 n=1 Tax=Tribolium madens TaxID=41895 RepID=UPI001CF7381F|nr:uncharacterized protein LOC123011308 isoform X1 [Tribolium madens]